MPALRAQGWRERTGQLGQRAARACPAKPRPLIGALAPLLPERRLDREEELERSGCCRGGCGA
eukprot:13055997-Alexandrium_andersonii.AAC.1